MHERPGVRFEPAAPRRALGPNQFVAHEAMPEICQHLASLTKLIPAAQHACPECVALGDTWVHLRVCQDCGHVGCCDDSKNKHATKHFHAVGHPVMASAQPGERWLWCYVDEKMLEY